jgi:hypothetical protein
MRMHDDLWAAMMGDLPCIEATEACIRQLQEKAIANHPALKAINQRIELVNEKIEEARRNNQRTISLGVFEPVVQYFLRVEEIPGRNGQPAQRRGFLDPVLEIIGGRGILSTVNDIFSLIGLPIFRNVAGGDAASQQRAIAISDLQVKIAEIENKRGEVANNLREQVILQVLEFDQLRREFQIAQTVAQREAVRLQVLRLDYQFAVGTMNTPSYLAQLSAHDQQKAQVFRHWARLRSQLLRVKLLVLGSEE